MRKFIAIAVLALAAAGCGGKPEPSSQVRRASCLAPAAGMRASLNGGRFLMGSEDFYAEEGPIRPADVAAFDIDAHEVTNRQFKAFVDATGYVTVAERAPDPVLHPDIPKSELVPGSAVFVLTVGERNGGFWRFEKGASWRAPKGPGSTIDAMMEHPAVHVAYEDALAYARWAGGDLPTEAEWEFAARGGLDGAPYEWGEEKPDDAPSPRANTWQGIFPVINSAADGYAGAAPVGCFPPNGYGLYDMTGNVWEWVKDSAPDRNQGLIKGGSYLCAENYCQRYRPAARHPQELDFSTNHIGFRVVYRRED